MRSPRAFSSFLLVLASAFATLAPRAVGADEGMWTVDHLPVDALQKTWGFTPTPEWIEHFEQACVQFPGGSGSFVSPTGLVLTNHHIARGQIQKLSSPEHDYMKDGFCARTRAQELPCPDLELKVLTSMENVTDAVRAAVDAKAPPKAQAAQRRAVLARLEKEHAAASGLQCKAVELYRGGEYWIYGSKKFTDVRLVMAPEHRTAFHGGDWDNFTFPRHDLDFAILRVYENGKPVAPKHWFRWSASGPEDGALVFVGGHPGSTNRLLGVPQLEYQRDVQHPVRIAQQEHRLAALRAYTAQGPEQKRRAADRILGLTNNLKRQRGFLEVLRRSDVIARARERESALRKKIAGVPALALDTRGAWERIAATERELERRKGPVLYRDLARVARLVDLAQQIVRYAAETSKPNAERFAEFRDSQLESQRFQILTPAPQYADVDAVTLGAFLTDARTALGDRDEFVKTALAGRDPETVARELMAGTKLADLAVRKRLLEGGRAAVEASDDPLIRWVAALEPSYRALRAWREEQIENVQALASGAIVRARFALEGKSIPPDATGTLRLSYGKVAGYEEGQTLVPWKTTLLGLYDRSAAFGRKEPFDLSAKVAKARPRLNLDTPLNFVSTCDIIGGNSGSPVLNRDLELVGLVFDGNIASFQWDYAYDDVQARCVSVHSSAILEALRRIYDMGPLADELVGARTPAPRAARTGAAEASEAGLAEHR